MCRQTKTITKASHGEDLDLISTSNEGQRFIDTSTRRTILKQTFRESLLIQTKEIKPTNRQLQDLHSEQVNSHDNEARKPGREKAEDGWLIASLCRCDI